MRKVDFNRKMMSSILVIVLAFCIFSPALAGGQQGGMGMMSSGMMGEGGQAQMMGQRMMGPGMMPMMRMEGLERMGLRKMGITGMLHRWGSYFFTRKDQLGLTEDQLDKIESILNSHIKYAIRKNADRKILLMEIQELLVKDKVDLGGVEEKLKAMEALNTDMNMEGVRTLEEALTVLTPEQRKKVKALFKGSTFFRAMSMGPSPGGMMGGCMMKGMMARGGAMAETKTAQASLTRTDSQGPVTVVVTYLNPQQKGGEGELAFEVKMDTHTVELGQYQLERLSILKNDRGEVVKPLRWEPSTKEGHHVSGTLIFSNAVSSGKYVIGSHTKYIEVVIKNIGGLKERIFKWIL